MAHFTNTGEGARGIVMRDLTTRFLDPGETLELDKDKVLSIGMDVEEGDGEASLSSMKVADLKALAEAEGIDLGDASKKDDIIAAIELARDEAEA